MPNRARGEVAIKVGDASYTIALTLGALAAIEAEFSAEYAEDVFADVLSAEKVNHTKLLRLLGAVFEANGHDAGTPSSLLPDDMATLALDLLEQAFPRPDESKKRKPATNP